MYRSLFTPLEVGSLTLKNRIVQAPLYVGCANEDGSVSQDTIKHYAKRAEGGAALVVVEASSVSPNSDNVVVNGIKIHDDRFLPGLSKLAEAIKAKGALAGMQLFHAGRYARISTPLSASAIPFSPMPDVTVTPKEMTLEEIDAAIGEFASCARRAKQAGFDMLELHGATGYLIVQFMSPLTNKRTDAYGGTLENRLRFPQNVLNAVRESTGADFQVGMRFLADDFLPGGFDVEQAQVLAGKLEEGGIAYLSITGGVYDSMVIPEIRDKLKEKGSLAYLAKEINPTTLLTVI